MMHTARCWKKGLARNRKNFKVIYTYEVKSKVENKAAQVEVKDETFTVYISGIDVYGAIETNSRSDVNILAVVNPNTHQVLLVTTPRDYYVQIPGISGDMRDKLTHAGIYGVDASMSTLGQLYNTSIEFYARVNFTSLVEMVDALGGIDVISEQAFTTSDDSGLVMDVIQGENHFNGEQALAFARERQNVDGGDFQRGRNQQAVITAMIKKAISPAILTGANGLLNSVSGNVDTNMSTEQIQTLVKNSAFRRRSMEYQIDVCRRNGRYTRVLFHGGNTTVCHTAGSEFSGSDSDSNCCSKSRRNIFGFRNRTIKNCEKGQRGK